MELDQRNRCSKSDREGETDQALILESMIGDMELANLPTPVDVHLVRMGV